MTTTIQYESFSHCAECGSACVSADGFVVCPSCGMVSERDYVSDGTAFHTRPLKQPQYPVPSFGSRRPHYSLTLNGVENTLIRHIEEICQVCNRLQIPPQTVDRACTIYSALHRPRKGPCTALTVASIHRAVVEHSLPFTMQDIISALELDFSIAGSLMTEARFAIVRRWGPVTRDPRSFVTSYVSRLGLEPSVQAEMIRRVLEIMELRSATSGRRSTLLVAGAIYIAAKEAHLHITQKDIASVTGHYAESIRQTVNTFWKPLLEVRT